MIEPITPALGELSNRTEGEISTRINASSVSTLCKKYFDTRLYSKRFCKGSRQPSAVYRQPNKVYCIASKINKNIRAQLSVLNFGKNQLPVSILTPTIATLRSEEAARL